MECIFTLSGIYSVWERGELWYPQHQKASVPSQFRKLYLKESLLFKENFQIPFSSVTDKFCFKSCCWELRSYSGEAGDKNSRLYKWIQLDSANTFLGMRCYGSVFLFNYTFGWILAPEQTYFFLLDLSHLTFSIKIQFLVTYFTWCWERINNDIDSVNNWMIIANIEAYHILDIVMKVLCVP